MGGQRRHEARRMVHRGHRGDLRNRARVSPKRNLPSKRRRNRRTIAHRVRALLGKVIERKLGDRAGAQMTNSSVDPASRRGVSLAGDTTRNARERCLLFGRRLLAAPANRWLRQSPKKLLFVPGARGLNQGDAHNGALWFSSRTLSAQVRSSPSFNEPPATIGSPTPQSRPHALQFRTRDRQLLKNRHKLRQRPQIVTHSA